MERRCDDGDAGADVVILDFVAPMDDKGIDLRTEVMASSCVLVVPELQSTAKNCLFG